MKPPRTFTLPSVNPTDTVATIKTQLALQPGVPPADAQRLLLRGKALADGKLLKEYNVKDGDVVNLMLKPGSEWDWNVSAKVDVQMNVDTAAAAPKRQLSHGRIPSVVLSPSPTAADITMDGVPTPINLTLDTSNVPSLQNSSEDDGFHRKMSDPGFWERLYAFLG